MQTRFSQSPFKGTRKAGAALSAVLIMFCVAGQALALPFGKAKDADEEEAPVLVPKLKLTKEQQTEFESSMKNGNAYLKQNSLELALICFMRCATLNPCSADSHLGIAYCYAGLKKTEQAISEIFESLKWDPNKTQARALLGDIMMAEARWDEAGGQYLQILKQAPDDTSARGNLATCFIMMGQLEPAVGQYKYILEKDPKSATAAYNLAALYELKNDYNEAMIYYKKAIELNPKNANAFCSLAKCLISRKDYKASQTLLDHAKKIAPDSYFVHLNQGYLNEVQEKTREAIEEYTRAVALNPKDADSKRNLERLLNNGGSGGKIKPGSQISGLKKTFH